MQAVPRSPCSIAAGVVLLVSASACGEDPFAPPRYDVRGEYDVEWTIIYKSLAGSSDSLPWGRCQGIVRIDRQDGHSFEGTIRVPAGVEFPCHPASFALTGTVTCGTAISSMPPYSLTESCSYLVLSDIEPLLACTYDSPDPSQVPPDYSVHGVLFGDEEISLGFYNVYRCESGRYLISSWARGNRRSRATGVAFLNSTSASPTQSCGPTSIPAPHFVRFGAPFG